MSATRLDALRTASRQGVVVSGRILPTVAVACGLGWSILFVAIGLPYGLQTFGDGAIFSYAIAAQDSWAFHWHNIPGRIFTYLVAQLPAQAFVAITGDAHGGIAVYGFLFFIAQFLGLAATFALDSSRGRVLFTYACVSTATLCPLVFGFPTETWMAHAMFWPVLALCHRQRPMLADPAITFLALLALLFTHEGAAIFAAAIFASLYLRADRAEALPRAGRALALALLIWIAVKFVAQPDEYFERIFARAALSVFDPEILKSEFVILMGQTLAGYGAACLILRPLAPGRAHMIAALLTAAALCLYWVHYDHALHAENRYYLRTAVLILTPAFGLAATISAAAAETTAAPAVARLSALLNLLMGSTARQAALGALLLVTLVHAVETAKFVAAWDEYVLAVRRLSMSDEHDVVLSDPRFVSASRLGERFDRVSWMSTTPFLSAVVAPGLAPARIVIDPRANYFWLSCRTARANINVGRGVPTATRRMIAAFSCLHRR